MLGREGAGRVPGRAQRSRPGWYPARLLHPSWSRLGGKGTQRRGQPGLGHARPGRGLLWSEHGERDIQAARLKEAIVPAGPCGVEVLFGKRGICYGGFG